MKHQLCLLIVDDEGDLLEAVTETCSHLGYDVIPVNGPEQALEALKTKSVDVVLTDVRMRPFSGFALLEKARELYPQVPFVMWTGFWENDDEAKAKSYSRVETLSKPFSLQQVQAVLDRLLALKSESTPGPLKGPAASDIQTNAR